MTFGLTVVVIYTLVSISMAESKAVSKLKDLLSGITLKPHKPSLPSFKDPTQKKERKQQPPQQKQKSSGGGDGGNDEVEEDAGAQQQQ